MNRTRRDRATRGVAFWLALVLCLALPLRGHAAGCGGSDVAAARATGGAAVHDHHAMPDGDAAMDAHGDPDVPSDGHGTCSACCGMAAISVEPYCWLPPAVASRAPPPFVQREAPSMRPDGLDRPPRDSSV